MLGEYQIGKENLTVLEKIFDPRKIQVRLDVSVSPLNVSELAGFCSAFLICTVLIYFWRAIQYSVQEF